MSEVIGRIEHIAIHPVKSAAAVEVPTARLTPAGLEGDRRLMIVRALPDERGVHDFVTQRDSRFRGEGNPQSMRVLTHIKPQIIDGNLVLTWDGNDGIEVSPDVDRGTELDVRIHKQEYHGAVDQGDRLAEWLSDHLQLGVRMVKAANNFYRTASQSYATNKNPLAFQDGYPVHWFLRESAEELSKVAGEEIPWQTFRPNIVVAGSEPRTEHVVFSGEVSGIPFVDPKPCDRCPVTNIDQKTGDLKIGRATTPLATYMNWDNVRGQRKVIFGENMLPQTEGQVSVGDEVVLIDRRDPPLAYGPKA